MTTKEAQHDGSETRIREHQDRQPRHLAVKLYRTEDLVTVAAPMPGLGPGDIAVVVSPGRRLVIVGRLCADADASCGTLKHPQKDVLLDEWEVGPYRRELELPTDVDGAAATLTYGNGILVIALPVAETTRPARLTLENVSTHLRGGRIGRPHRRIGGMRTDGVDARHGAALLAAGAAALYLIRRGAVRGSLGLLALATSTIASAMIERALRPREADPDAGASGDAAPREGASGEGGPREGAPRDGASGDAARQPPSSNPVDETSRESFPASDAPSWTGTRARAFD